MRKLWVLVALLVVLCLPATASATTLYVATQGYDAVTAFHIGSGGSLTKVPCTGSNCFTGTCPEQLALTPNGRALYATDCSSNLVNEFSSSASGALSPLCTSACPGAGPDPLGIAVAPNGKFAYVGSDDLGGSEPVSAYSVGSAGTLSPITCPGCIGGESPVGVSVTPDGRFVFVADQGVREILEYSIQSNGSLSQLCTSTCPAAGTRSLVTALTPNGKFLYAADAADNLVLPYAINSDGGLTRIACSTCTTDAMPWGITVAPNGRFLYTANENTDSISAFAINAGGTLTPISCPSCSTPGGSYVGVAVDPSSRYLYGELEIAGGTQIRPFSIGSGGSLTPVNCASSICTVPGTADLGALAISPDPAPVARFKHSAARARKAMKFNASGSSASSGQTVTRFAWSFGDGKRSVKGGPKTKHRYRKAGRYRVTLTVTDSLGCSTQRVYTGQTMSCNGSRVARVTHVVRVRRKR